MARCENRYFENCTNPFDLGIGKRYSGTLLISLWPSIPFVNRTPNADAYNFSLFPTDFAVFVGPPEVQFGLHRAYRASLQYAQIT